MSGSANRLNWVDAAKGMSIILVVMMHSAYGVGEATGDIGVLHWIIGFAAPFRMPEFFLISGLFLSLVIGRDWRPFADRRVVHYFYFYALWAVLQILFKVGLGARDPGLAAEYLAFAVIEPYGVLWFIYMLAVFSAVTKLLYETRVPHWLTLPVLAVLQLAPVATGIGILDNFAEYAVYFYLGYAASALVFRFVDWAENHVVIATLGLAVWALVNGLLVFLPGFEVLPVHMVMGIGGLPGMRLVLAVAGSLALCAAAALLMKLKFMNWLRWLGSKSIVVYLSFSIPMALTREILIRLDVFSDTSVISVIVLAVALLAPLVLYALIQWTGFGKFLFERPRWAHLPGTGRATRPASVPAE